MKTTGLSGKSGTGKSYNAIELSSRLGVDGIIDDGLFIFRGIIAAGISAKKQKTKVGAVKTALFYDDEHQASVVAAINRLKPEHILILGTSDEMVEKIAERLGIPKPERIIQIEEITTEEDRKKAEALRTEEGMHTIPAPTFQVKKQFSGYFIDPARAFKKEMAPVASAKSVVRPTYSYLGSYEISDRAIEQIVGHICHITPGIAEMLFTSCVNGDDGMYVRVIILGEKGAKIKSAAETLQKHVTAALSHMTSFNILGVEIEIRGYL